MAGNVLNCNTCDVTGCVRGKDCSTLKGLLNLITAMKIQGDTTKPPTPSPPPTPPPMSIKP
ncbi:hypothetical protein GB937_002727 [Aspergillus fischeri]|nr:hypothetical protein GB937_002727 [Aspergillus fischeri]